MFKDLACAVLCPGRISDATDTLSPAKVEAFKRNFEDEQAWRATF